MDDHKGDLCVFVVGTESSGSKLIARILAHALGIRPYGTWNASGWATSPESPHRICHRSRRQRWPERPRNIMREVMRTCSYTIWSYETFMLLRDEYLQGLYRFLGIESTFMPADVTDGNAKHVLAGA